MYNGKIVVKRNDLIIDGVLVLPEFSVSCTSLKFVHSDRYRLDVTDSQGQTIAQSVIKRAKMQVLFDLGFIDVE